MQFCHWIPVADSKRECIGRYDTLRRQFAEDTACLPCVNPLADYSEVFVVTGTLVRIAFEAKRLKIGQIVLATVFARDNMIDLDSSLVCRNATQLAAKPGTLHNFITKTSGEVAQRGPTMVVDGRSAFLQIGVDRCVT
jgi:hypothetical protein